MSGARPHEPASGPETRAAAPAAEDPRPVVRVVAGRLPEAVDGAEVALLEAGPGPIFQRAGELVHIASRPARRSDETVVSQDAIAMIEFAAVREAFNVARFTRWDARERDWRTIDPPRDVVETYRARSRWRLPDLQALVAAPLLRSDGTLLAEPGYDAATGWLLTAVPAGLAVPDEPSDAEAARANEELVGLCDSFPFADEGQPAGTSLAVALAGLLSAILRPSLPAAPLIGVSAPAAGSGKSYLIDVLSVVATGRRAVAIATGAAPEELEKALGAALLSGRPVLSLDNMTQPLGGQLICLAITQERVDIRLLGLSKTVELPVAAQLFATGNNLKIKGDATRRCLVCRLDAGVERPEQREFERAPLDEAERRRGQLVSAALTIARWGRRVPPPAHPEGQRFAGFEQWCAWVRDPLLALGHADPVAALETARATDPDRERLAALLVAWAGAIGHEQAITAAEAARRGEARTGAGGPLEPGLADALVAVAGDTAGRINTRRLGNFLARSDGRIVDGRVLRRAGSVQNAVTWQVTTDVS